MYPDLVGHTVNANPSQWLSRRGQHLRYGFQLRWSPSIYAEYDYILYSTHGAHSPRRLLTYSPLINPHFWFKLDSKLT